MFSESEAARQRSVQTFLQTPTLRTGAAGPFFPSLFSHRYHLRPRASFCLVLRALGGKARPIDAEGPPTMCVGQFLLDRKIDRETNTEWMMSPWLYVREVPCRWPTPSSSGQGFDVRGCLCASCLQSPVYRRLISWWWHNSSAAHGRRRDGPCWSARVWAERRDLDPRSQTTMTGRRYSPQCLFSPSKYLQERRQGQVHSLLRTFAP